MGTSVVVDHQDDCHVYFQPDSAGSVTEGSSFTYPFPTYQNYTSMPATPYMYEQQVYDHQNTGGSTGAYSHWSHPSSSNMNSLLQRSYSYPSANNYGLPAHQQPTPPLDRSDSAQSFTSTASCTSIQSPLQSPSSRSNSNCNSPSVGQIQLQTNYQELYSPV